MINHCSNKKWLKHEKQMLHSCAVGIIGKIRFRLGKIHRSANILVHELYQSTSHYTETWGTKINVGLIIIKFLVINILHFLVTCCFPCRCTEIKGYLSESWSDNTSGKEYFTGLKECLLVQNHWYEASKCFVLVT